MNPPSFWAHDGTLFMSMKEIGTLQWSKFPQSSKKLKGKVLKARCYPLRHLLQTI